MLVSELLKFFKNLILTGGSKMKSKSVLWGIVLILVLSFTVVSAQKDTSPILTFDDGASNWFTACESDQNQFSFADYYDDNYEGFGCMEITAKFREIPNDWGTYTEAIWEFENKLDFIQFNPKDLQCLTASGLISTPKIFSFFTPNFFRVSN